GGQGFCTILEGVWRYVRGKAANVQDEPVAAGTALSTPAPAAPVTQPLSPLKIENLGGAASAAQPKKGRVTIEEEFGYEVVFLLRGEKLDVEGIRQTIIDMGGVS